MENLTGKCVVLGISGGIAAYKMADVASALRKAGADVHVLMTENAAKFITPITFETLTYNKCIIDTFDRNFKFDVAHISLAQKADVMLIAPATADIIAKMAHGIADDMLTTVVLAAKCPKLVSPSMNTAMLENPITQDNIARLEHYGFEIIESDSGFLACGDTGKGKLPAPSVLVQHIERVVAHDKDMKGVKVTVTAGATREAIDPVRFLSNNSTGKMGYAIARQAMLRGADVTLITGKTSLPDIPFVKKVDITSAEDMFKEVTSRLDDTDILIKAAAVADYRPVEVADNKIKKKDGDMSIPLARTKDILKYCGAHKRDGLFLCGFSMETENMIDNSRAKLEKKNLDMIACNNVKQAGAGFGVDTNVITLITKDSQEELPLLSKDEAASMLLDAIMKRR
jgi:phosphopantothenoylcysteine decarboxylase/phosphopantothenate--cysteine ligase